MYTLLGDNRNITGTVFRKTETEAPPLIEELTVTYIIFICEDFQSTMDL